jgi:hypothetical protein
VSADPTAVMISFTVMSPLLSASPLGHADNGAFPRAMFTMMISSFTVTVPLPSQSPVHASIIVAVGTGILVGVGLMARGGVGVMVCAGGLVGVEVNVGV